MARRMPTKYVSEHLVSREVYEFDMLCLLPVKSVPFDLKLMVFGITH